MLLVLEEACPVPTKASSIADSLLTGGYLPRSPKNFNAAVFAVLSNLVRTNMVTKVSRGEYRCRAPEKPGDERVLGDDVPEEPGNEGVRGDDIAEKSIDELKRDAIHEEDVNDDYWE